MFFIKFGTVIAWGAVIIGGIKITSGLLVAITTSNNEMLEMSKRYLGTETSGQAIDQGLYTFTSGILIGLLVQIAKK